MQISKSNYMNFLRHPAWLWIEKHDKSKIPPIDDNTQALFDAGHKFEPFAESLFPEGVTLGFSDYDEYLSLPQRTQDAITRGDKVLFQPRFEWNEFTCISDIVSFVEDDVVDLYEIKASTSAKVDHEFDLAFQTAVLEGTGLKVRNIYVIHVNNKYVRHGEIEADKITHIQDITEKVRAKGELTEKYMPMALAIAQSNSMPDPDPALAKLGSKAGWLTIYENIFPSEPTVWPEDIKPTIDYEKVTSFVDGLQYPLYFLDYETMSGLVPYFDGHRPYQQVPTQYSLHILRSPDAEQEINDRVVDLIIPFKKKWYDDPRFEGSASIKKVLPVLCPELSYKTLGIQEGGSAQRLWMEAVLDGTRAAEKDKILADLLEYCKLDTLAMVEIYKVLRNLNQTTSL